MSTNRILILKGSPRENGNSSILADGYEHPVS
jgi:hypothetical protein